MRTFALARSTGIHPADSKLHQSLCKCKLSQPRCRRVRSFCTNHFNSAQVSLNHAYVKHQRYQQIVRRLPQCHAYTEERPSISNAAPILGPLRQARDHRHAEHVPQHSQAAESSSDLFPSSHVSMHGMLDYLSFAAYFPFGELD